MDLKPYLKVLDQIETQTGAHLSKRQTKTGLIVNGQRFVSRQTQEASNPEYGIITRTMGAKTAKQFIEAERSFLTLDGELYLAKTDSRLQINIKRLNQKPSKPKKLRQSISPTLIVSPNGLSIADVIFRASSSELQSFSSGLSFTKHYALVQAKLSQMMTSLKAKSVVELKERLLDLSLEWWTNALRDPMTRKRMTPFFDVALTHYINSTDEPDDISSIVLESDGLIAGPLNAARDLGFLRSKDSSYWAVEETIRKVKKKYRLIPGTRPDKPICYLASPKRSLTDEAIASRLVTAKEIDAISPKYNTLRSVWDMGFGDERVQEIQIDCMNKLIEKARSEIR
ncbi:MAG: hypothetical protein J0L82_10060 [Deltaproteobacteria bacterium]|jgi:hypothetical protein|nr:hypothetical protein [Deltaproteobacteria bacterium]